MQHKPRFSGIIIAAVLMVAALVMISSYSSLFGSSKSTMMLSEAMGYFESNQVTYFNLDLNTGVIEMSVKEGEHPLPESGTSSETSNGLLAEIYGDGTDAYAPKNGGAAVITYKLPYPSYFLQFYLKDYIDQYNAANPDAPMQYDMVAVKTNVPWFEIILYAFMIGSVVLLFMSMYRGGAGGGGLMNVGRAKVKDQQEGQRKATFADVAGADEEKAELQEVVQFLKAPEKFNSLGARIPHGVLLVALRAPAKRCWPVPVQARPAFRSMPSPVPTLWKCMSASAHPVCAICLKKPKRQCPPSSLLMRSMPWAVSVVPALAAGMTSASRP